MAQLPVTARSYLNSGEPAIPQPFYASEVLVPGGDVSKGPQVRLARPSHVMLADPPVSMLPAGPNGTGRGGSFVKNGGGFDSPSPIDPAPLRKFRPRSPVPDCAGQCLFILRFGQLKSGKWQSLCFVYDYFWLAIVPKKFGYLFMTYDLYIINKFCVYR